jgi:hypothetical protein
MATNVIKFLTPSCPGRMQCKYYQNSFKIYGLVLKVHLSILWIVNGSCNIETNYNACSCFVQTGSIFIVKLNYCMSWYIQYWVNDIYVCTIHNIWKIKTVLIACFRIVDSNMCSFLDAELPVVMETSIQQALTNITSTVQADLWTGITSYKGVRILYFTTKWSDTFSLLEVLNPQLHFKFSFSF